MKLRIFQNSIRIRLGQSEVASLADRGSLEESLQLTPDTSLTYRLVSSDRSQATHASLKNGALELAIPSNMLRRWALGDDVSLTAEQDNGAGGLNILLEKDFHCLHREGSAEDVDAYPNPSAI